MKTKLSFFLVAISLCMSALAADVPAQLFMRGTALAESSTPLVMKRINKDFPDFYNGAGEISNTFELFTALKSGNYEFAASESGAAIISSATITVDKEGLVPYRIRVNFDESTPEVTVSEVEEMIIWAPSKKFVVANLDYMGNSSFIIRGLEYSKDTWGDPRYRFRVYTADGDIKTYAYKKGNLTGPDDDSNETGYFDLYQTTAEGQWDETIDGVKYQGAEFKLSKKRRGEGFTLAPFDVKVVFDPVNNYTHVISDYDPTGIVSTNAVSKGEVYPTAINDQVTIAVEKGALAVDFISATGITVLQAKSADSTLTLNNISLPKGVFLVKIVQDNNVLSVKRVIKL